MVALAVLARASPVHAPDARTSHAAAVKVVHANDYLSLPAPRASRLAWTSAPGRRTVALRVGDTVLRGWAYAARSENAPVVLVFGGNGYSIASVDRLLRALAAQGAPIVEYDYRGVGLSDGTADVFAMRSDALRLYDATVKQSGGKPIVVFGYSLGSIFASFVASSRNVRGVVLVSPLATSAAEMAYLMKPGTYRIAPDSVEAQNVVGFVAKSRAPLLVAHGTVDRVIPIGEGRAVYAASRASKKVFLAVPGAGHEALFADPHVLRAFKDFLHRLTSEQR